MSGLLRRTFHSLSSAGKCFIGAQRPSCRLPAFTVSKLASSYSLSYVSNRIALLSSPLTSKVTFRYFSTDTIQNSSFERVGSVQYPVEHTVEILLKCRALCSRFEWIPGKADPRILAIPGQPRACRNDATNRPIKNGGKWRGFDSEGTPIIEVTLPPVIPPPLSRSMVFSSYISQLIQGPPPPPPLPPELQAQRQRQADLESEWRKSFEAMARSRLSATQSYRPLVPAGRAKSESPDGLCHQVRLNNRYCNDAGVGTLHGAASRDTSAELEDKAETLDVREAGGKAALRSHSRLDEDLGRCISFSGEAESDESSEAFDANDGMATIRRLPDNYPLVSVNPPSIDDSSSSLSVKFPAGVGAVKGAGSRANVYFNALSVTAVAYLDQLFGWIHSSVSSNGRGNRAQLPSRPSDSFESCVDLDPPEPQGSSVRCPRFGMQLICMLSHDKVCLAVWENGRLRRHKVLTGYTVRRCSGGSQDRHDREDGRARGPGAALRREETRRLWRAVRAELYDWRADIAVCTALFRAGDVRCWNLLYQDAHPAVPVDRQDPRWRNLSVNDGPGHDEMIRIFRMCLCMGQINRIPDPLSESHG